MSKARWYRLNSDLEFPILIGRFDSPFELFSQCLGEELFNGHVELLGEDNRQTRINVILCKLVDIPAVRIGGFLRS